MESADNSYRDTTRYDFYLLPSLAKKPARRQALSDSIMTAEKQTTSI